jgi:hypothetical protein
MSKLIGTTKLRNTRRIFKQPDGFKVVQIDGKGVEHPYRFTEYAIDTLYALCSGETVTSDEATFRIQPMAQELGLPYHYGWKLKFLTQEMLLVLEVLRQVNIHRDGNRYLYEFE